MRMVGNAVNMIGGLGKTSYAMNSEYQNKVLSKAKPFLENAITDFYVKYSPKCLTIVDLGCSSGPNTLAVIEDVVDAIGTFCQNSDRKLPEFYIALSDLYGNDFNTLFKYIPNLMKKIKKDKGGEFGPCFISGVPGSFYGRLFPSESVHLFHSSTALHHLSQVPAGIENTKGNVYIANNTPPNILKAYLAQHQKDFTLFLSSRSQEIVPGGRMVLTLIGRRSPDPTKECCQIMGLLAKSLGEMVSVGRVDEAKLDSFNMPLYHPSSDELTTIIQEQGSFSLDWLEMFDVNWDTSNDLQNNDFVFDKKISGQNVSSVIRAVMEPLIVHHFGEDIIEELFSKYAENLGDYLTKHRGYHVNLLMCLTKKP